MRFSGSRSQETTTAQTWFQQYNYDFAGNRWLDGSSSFQGQAPVSQSWYDSTTNRVSAGYDTAGNILALNNLTNAYDSEGRMTSSGNSTSGVVTYSYDGAGHRVASSSYLGNKTFIYDAQDQLVAEYSDKASGTTGTLYLGMDGLGSTRVVTDASAAVVRCLDYLPFGEELSQGVAGRPSCFGNYTYPAGADDSVSEKFTGAKRDGETGLDFLESRYYAGYLGRFMSPDEPLNDQNVSDPQSWNLYAYARNNPLRFADPTGTTICDANGDNCHDEITVNGGSIDALPYFWDVLNSFGSQAAQTAANITNSALQFITAPRDRGCVGRAAGIGAAGGGIVGGILGATGGGAAGAVSGTFIAPGFGTFGVGFAGGAAGLTQGTGYGALAGGALGSAVGFITCASGTGPGGGGGKDGEFRPKTKGANADDAKTIRDVAREEGVDARRFGKFIEAEKRAEGRGASENYSYDELKALAKAFKAEGH